MALRGNRVKLLGAEYNSTRKYGVGFWLHRRVRKIGA